MQKKKFELVIDGMHTAMDATLETQTEMYRFEFKLLKGKMEKLTLKNEKLEKMLEEARRLSLLMLEAMRKKITDA